MSVAAYVNSGHHVGIPEDQRVDQSQPRQENADTGDDVLTDEDIRNAYLNRERERDNAYLVIDGGDNSIDDAVDRLRHIARVMKTWDDDNQKKGVSRLLEEVKGAADLPDPVKTEVEEFLQGNGELRNVYFSRDSKNSWMPRNRLHRSHGSENENPPQQADVTYQGAPHEVKEIIDRIKADPELSDSFQKMLDNPMDDSVYRSFENKFRPLADTPDYAFNVNGMRLYYLQCCRLLNKRNQIPKEQHHVIDRIIGGFREGMEGELSKGYPQDWLGKAEFGCQKMSTQIGDVSDEALNEILEHHKTKVTLSSFQPDPMEGVQKTASISAQKINAGTADPGHNTLYTGSLIKQPQVLDGDTLRDVFAIRQSSKGSLIKDNHGNVFKDPQGNELHLPSKHQLALVMGRSDKFVYCELIAAAPFKSLRQNFTKNNGLDLGSIRGTRDSLKGKQIQDFTWEAIVAQRRDETKMPTGGWASRSVMLAVGRWALDAPIQAYSRSELNAEWGKGDVDTMFHVKLKEVGITPPPEPTRGRNAAKWMNHLYEQSDTPKPTQSVRTAAAPVPHKSEHTADGPTSDNRRIADIEIQMQKLQSMMQLMITNQQK